MPALIFFNFLVKLAYCDAERVNVYTNFYFITLFYNKYYTINQGDWINCFYETLK